MSDKIRCVSLWQPWADLIAWGLKTIETRNRNTKYRGPILICGAKKNDRMVKDYIRLYQSRWWWSPNARFQVVDPGWTLDPGYIPRLGQAVAVANLVDSRPLTQDDWREAAFGPHWSVTGKWAWVLEDVQAIEPFDIKGQRGFWSIDPNDEIREWMDGL